MSIPALSDLVKNAVSAFAGGGSDPWTYVRLATLFATTGTTNADSPLAFTPQANKIYEIEGRFFMQSAATTTGIRPGIKWPTAGVAQNAAWIISPTSATAFVSRIWGDTSAANAAATAAPVANEGIYGQMQAMLVTSASPVNNFIVTLSSEVSGSEVRLMQNSFIRYRVIP